MTRPTFEQFVSEHGLDPASPDVRLELLPVFEAAVERLADLEAVTRCLMERRRSGAEAVRLDDPEFAAPDA